MDEKEKEKKADVTGTGPSTSFGVKGTALLVLTFQFKIFTMHIETIFKRSHSKMPFQIEKITEAVLRAMVSVENGTPQDAEGIAKQVNKDLIERKKKIPNYVPNVEEIQDLVEQTLMKSKFLDVAKAYILYRNIQTKKRQRNIFERRMTLKPFEYPELYEYVPAIRHSYWIHTEFNFTSDIQDFKTHLSLIEKMRLKTRCWQFHRLK
jgi:ribonucleoside-diphosphate reductase beta chain